MLRIQQFARLANVTVRTLHYYDRLGLLSPTLRSAGGYRLYRMEDLAQLERILVLRYLGVPLQEIAVLLPAPPATGGSAHTSLSETLARQTTVLCERRDGINRVLKAIERARQAIEARRPTWSPELQEKITADWQQMYADVKSAIDRQVVPPARKAKPSLPAG